MVEPKEMEGYLRSLYVQIFQRKAQKIQMGLTTEGEDAQIELLKEIIAKVTQ